MDARAHAAVDHAFVVPAYGESPHLDACLASLVAQDIASPIVLATSTPSAALERAAARHGADYAVNPAGGGIGVDWNFALASTGARWVTIAHQDDVYLPHFGAGTRAAIASNPDASLVFTRYAELVGDDIRDRTTLLAIKLVLLELGFAGRSRAASRFAKTNTLRFGCAIPCPSVTLDRTTGLRFREDLRIDLDWDAWLGLASRPGSFVYVRELSMLHRVHGDSETSAGIAGGVRGREDRELLGRMWPAPIASAIAATYGIAYRSNAS